MKKSGINIYSSPDYTNAVEKLYDIDPGGATFSKGINLSNNSGNSYNQEIAVFANNAYVVWEDKTVILK